MVLQSWTPLVRVGGALTVLIPSQSRLVERCGNGGDYDACTRFVAYRLDASCVERENGWSIIASARFTPYVMLRNPKRFAHEFDHVSDIRMLTERYLGSLERERFDSPDVCRGRALDESSRFGSTLQSFALDSNRRLH